MKKSIITLLFLLFIVPFEVNAAQRPDPSLQAEDGGITVTVSDPKGQLPDDARVTLKKGSASQENSKATKARKELNKLDPEDGSFVSQRYENTSVKESTPYLYDVKITYREKGEEKEYVPEAEDGVSLTFSVKDEDYTEDTKELDVFHVTKSNPELITDSVQNDKGVEVKAREKGQYLLLSMDYIAKAAPSDKLEAEEKAAELLARVDPDQFLKDEFAGTYSDAEFAEMQAGAREAIRGISGSRDQIEALTKLVAERTYYDYPYLDNNETLTALQPYDVWTKKITVCDGYSRLLATLCISVDIPCFRIYSDDHAYNACYDRDNKRWIVVDATWASGNKYTTDKEMKEGSYRAAYFDMEPSFMAQLSNHEVFSLSGILDHNIYYTYYPNYTASYWGEMKWDTWTDLSDWHLKISGLKEGTVLNTSTESLWGLPVTEVENYSFDNKNLTQVTLPASVEEIEAAAFRGNYDLKTVNIPGSKDLNVLYMAFYDDKALESVNIGNRKLNIVDASAFANAEALKTFGDDLLEIDQVSGGAFRGCSLLEDPVKITGKAIESQAFYRCGKIPSIDAASSTATEIGSYAFRYCTSLAEFTFPSTLESIGYASLDSCSGIQELDLSHTSLKTIDGMGLSGMNSLSVIKLPASLESSEGDAFRITDGSFLDTFVIGNSNKDALCYQKDDRGAWRGRRVHFGSSILTAVFDDGENTTSIKTTPEEGLTAPQCQRTKDYYAFQGWKDGADHLFEAGTHIDPSVSDTEIHYNAMWKPVDYAISYELDGGLNGDNPLSYNIESGTMTLKDPAKEGFAFMGWFADPDYETQVDKITSQSPADLTLYAKWECAHMDTKLVDKKEASCQEEGYSGDTICSTCKEIVETGDIIPKTAHQWDEVSEREEATCIEDGHMAYWHCSTCQKYYQDQNGEEEIAEEDLLLSKDKAAHVLTHYDGVDSTCQEEGREEYWYCQVCGRYFSDEEGDHGIDQPIAIDKKEHAWDQGEITQEPSCSEKGIRTYTCTSCGGTKTEAIAKLPHSLIYHEGISPTMDSTGILDYWECSDCGQLFTDDEGKKEISGPEILEKLEPAAPRAARTLKKQTIVTRNKTIKISFKKLKKKKQSVKASLVTRGNKARTKLSYRLLKVNKKKYRKYFKVSRAGQITVKKKLKKGTYKLYLRASAPANAAYKKAMKTFIITIRVK